MFEGINEVAVLVSALMAIAVGSVWYSPAVFGKAWMRAAGLTEEDMASSKDVMARLFAFAAGVNLILAFVLAHFVAYAAETATSLYLTATLLVIFGAAAMLSSIIWEQKPVRYFLINVSYMAVCVFGVMSILAFWPW